MDLGRHNVDIAKVAERRQVRRLPVHCRARIVIGTRHYAGYVSDISSAGAKLKTITPIRKPGTVLLRLPDLPPLRCELRWADACDAGVAFAKALSGRVLEEWLGTRAATTRLSERPRAVPRGGRAR